MVTTAMAASSMAGGRSGIVCASRSHSHDVGGHASAMAPPTHRRVLDSVQYRPCSTVGRTLANHTVGVVAGNAARQAQKVCSLKYVAMLSSFVVEPSRADVLSNIGFLRVVSVINARRIHAHCSFPAGSASTRHLHYDREDTLWPPNCSRLHSSNPANTRTWTVPQLP